MAFETSACKGWAYDADVIGAFSVFNFEADSHLDPPKLVEVEKFWILPRDEHWIRETEYCTVDRCRNKTAF